MKQRVKTFYDDWIDPIIGWLKELSQGQRALLAAVLFLGGVGAYGTHSFFSESRGDTVGWMAAIGIELLYLGSAGIAVKQSGQVWLARFLMIIGAVGSAFFNVLVGLRQRLPDLFATKPIWPDYSQLAVHGIVSLVEGVIIPLAALLVAWLLHSIISQRLIETDEEEQRRHSRRDMKPFSCPFCPAAFDSPAKLYGHSPRCEEGRDSNLTDGEKKAIIRKAVDEGNDRLARG